MKKSIYPSKTGVPSLALIGVSGAGKSSLAEKLLPKPVSSAAKIAGKSSAQTTLIPTQFYIRNHAAGAASLQLRITLRSFPVQDFEMRVDEDAVFAAIQHRITSFSKVSKGSGIPLAALNDYIGSAKYLADLHAAVNGAVRLEKVVSDEFDVRAANCAKSLIEDFDVAQVDSSVSKLQGDAEKAQTKILVLRDLLRQRWDMERKDEDSPVCSLLQCLCRLVWEQMKALLPGINETGEPCTFSFDLSDDEDSRAFTELLDPYAPLSLIVEKYEVACGMGDVIKKVFDENTANWPDDRLPFRLVLTDTVGLTQDTQENEYDIARRLRAALNSGCQGILLMLPAGLRDEQQRSIQRRFSNESEEGRQIRRNNIPVFLGIARADEEVTPRSEIDGDSDEEEKKAFAAEMEAIWGRLTDIQAQWQSRYSAQEARYLTNQPKKLATYLKDLDDIDHHLAGDFRAHLGNRSALNYLFDITSNLQAKLFPSTKPIFLKATQAPTGGPHIRLHVVPPEYTQGMAAALAVASSNFTFQKWLHWRTAYAFRDSVYDGHRFISRATVNGRIHVYIDGDASKASKAVELTIPQQCSPGEIQFSGIDLTAPETQSLYNALALDQSTATELQVKAALKLLFIQHFTQNNSWRFHRAMDRAIRRLSFSDAQIKDQAKAAFEQGRRAQDPSGGVDQMLAFYRNLYQSPQLADLINEVLNQELSDEFNNFFFPVY